MLFDDAIILAEMAMTNVQTTIKFDGPALDGKAMDVAQLAPALLALSDLVRETNRHANGDRAGVRVLVSADLEQKCFELSVELAQTIWEQAKLLIADGRVRTAKEIAEWLGIIGAPGYGLFWLIKWLRGRRIESVTVINVSDGNNVVEIEVEGENPVQISQVVYGLYANPQTRKKAVDVLAPLREEGYETLEFYEKDDVQIRFTEADVPSPDGADLPEVIPQNLHTSVIRTGVRIRRPAYEGQAKWTVVYKRAIDAAFDDAVWLNDFQSGKAEAPPGSSLDVDLEEQYITNENDEIIGDPVYRIKKVHGVKLPMKQRRLEFINKNSEIKN